MKISELSTDKALDVLCEITPHINAIVSDEDLIKDLKMAASIKEKLTTKAQLIAFGVKRVNVFIPIVLKKNRSAVYGILSALNGKTAEEIANQNSLITINEITEIVQDKELIDFFKSRMDMEGDE